MFDIGDKIVHPMHGAGVIDSIVTQKVNGTSREYYVVKIPAGGMVVMIPINNTGEIGVRAVIDGDRAQEILDSMKDLEIDVNTNWNRRYRENMLRIRSGDLIEVSKVIKSLMARERVRSLSTGERKMLHSAKQILISELVLAQCSTYEDVEAVVNAKLA